MPFARAFLCAAVVLTGALSGFPQTAWAAGETTLPGAGLSIWWAVPFAGLLLSIAILPLATPTFWHHHFGKISLAWALAVIVPIAFFYSPTLAGQQIVHTMLDEFIPFLILILALFVVAGGVLIKGNLHGSPALNTGLLAIGTGVASITGTTGAAMLFIRPLVRANDGRRHNAHVVVFFIFLVANIGGSLTPLGDPPLFLGFLKGVDFFWPTGALLRPMLLCTVILLVLFYVLDTYMYAIDKAYRRPDPTPDNPLSIEGKVNIVLLFGILAAVLMSGLWKPGISWTVLGTTVHLQNVARDVILLGITGLSLALTSRDVREGNGFSWGPIVEVAKLFAGIFITLIPALAILRAGKAGALGWLVDLATLPNGQPNNLMYFWLAGGLSSFLDNAPTYLVFFNMAGGDAAILMGPLSSTLLAISAGAVFMGANTYIGNAPNLMVKAIAEDMGVKMPSFFGYMLWSIAVLIPCFLLVSWLFFM
jgi:Na+/H+ antiporter NhaD/arsenite permease-like protein